MSVVVASPGDAIRFLAERGLSFDEIAAIADAFSGHKERAADTARQERNRRHYEKTKRLKASENRLKASESEASESRLKASESVLIQTPLARVVDNPLRLVIDSSAASSAEREDDWPKGEPGDLARTLASLAGPGMADFHKSPGLCSTSPEIVRWRQAGCSWSLDVVPIVQARTAKARASPLASWTPLTPDVLGAKARRNRPLPEPSNEPPDHGKTPRQDRLGRMQAGALAALDG